MSPELQDVLVQLSIGCIAAFLSLTAFVGILIYSSSKENRKK